MLVQYSNDLWTNATVQDILEDRSAFCIKYDKNKEIAEVKPLQLVPLGHDDRVENDSEDDIDAEVIFLALHCLHYFLYAVIDVNNI